ncbi:hypothetical protein LZC95_37795 [Pendulispora brunnea]|uniref:Tetratricopeptide repeat protein n=1 Tax=Pendulispora brunnea TaxID=2905690 RepID=A0ABZ2K770_9BACT
MAKLHSAFFALCVALTAPTVAFAADGPGSPTPDKQKTADEWADEAFALVAKGEYPKAIAAYQRAYQISADGRNLYNIANIYDRKLHEREVAADYYRRYLHLSQTEPDLTKRATERLAALKEEEEAIRKNAAAAPANGSSSQGSSIVMTPASRASASSAERPDTTRSTMQIGGIIAGGTGLALIGAGAVFGMIAKSKNDDASKLCNGSACNDKEALNLTDDARRAATISTIGFVAGGVAVAGGLLLYFLAPDNKRSAALQITPKVGPQMAGITLGGAWR